LSTSNVAEAGENDNNEVQTQTDIKGVDHRVLVIKND
jgi:hypothetical protein